jgi:divalent metal cation (Fe/Co/Zn/Cd) transporter
MPPIRSTPFKVPAPPITASDARLASRSTLIERGHRLNLIGLAWTSLEAIVAIVAGAMSGSVSLLSFGLDAGIELAAGLIAVWRLAGDAHEHRERIEHQALKLIGWSLLALAAYVALESVHELLKAEAPKRSLPGVAIAVLSVLFMPWLAKQKRSVAMALKSKALQAHATQTALCGWLAAFLLVGQALDVTLGWWWADAVAALAMTPIIAREGLEAVRGHAPCGCEPAIDEVHARRAPVLLTTERT